MSGDRERIRAGLDLIVGNIESASDGLPGQVADAAWRRRTAPSTGADHSTAPTAPPTPEAGGAAAQFWSPHARRVADTTHPTLARRRRADAIQSLAPEMHVATARRMYLDLALPARSASRSSTAYPILDPNAGHFMIGLARKYAAQGQLQKAHRRFSQVDDLAQRLGDPDLDEAVTLAWSGCVGLRSARPGLDVPDRLAAAIERCAARTDTRPARRQRLLLSLAHLSLRRNDAARARSIAREVVDLAGRFGDERAGIEAILTMRQSTWASMTAHERLTAFATLGDHVDGSLPAELHARVVAAHVTDQLAADQTDRADELVEALERRSGEHRIIDHWASLQRASIELRNHRDPARHLERAIERDLSDGVIANDPLGVLLILHADRRHRLAASRGTLEGLRAERAGSLFFRAAHARAALDDGDTETAAAELDRVGDMVTSPCDGTAVAGALWLHDTARALDHPSIETLRDMLVPHRGTIAVGGWLGVIGPVDAALAA